MVFTRPENALSRANELIAVGKSQAALDTLSEVLSSRRHRTWTKTHQPIMEKYLELCVELRKSDRSKDGLYQYKNICQSVNVGSLEEVIMGFLKLATSKTEEARKLSQASSQDVDDLDSIQTPEGLIRISEQGITSARGQQEKDAYMSSLRFLWDSYRQCLDVLKNNSRVEMQYKIVAVAALQFALKYQRKFEFRKCCEAVRQHLQLAYKHMATMTYSIKLDNPDSIRYIIDVRMCIFETAVKLDLWQEAFKAIEEIHDIMHQAKLQFTPVQYVNYYSKASQVFWYAGYYAAHAYALLRHFLVFHEQKSNATPEELARHASRLVLAALSIPSYTVRTQVDKVLEIDLGASIDRHRDVHHLLDLSQAPSRSRILQDIKMLRITSQLPKDNTILNLLNNLETEFDPLSIRLKIDTFIEYLSTQTLDPSLVQYGPKLKDVACMRFLQQASQVYRNLTYERLIQLCPCCDSNNQALNAIVDNYVAQMCRANAIEVRINDQSQTLTFSSDLCAIPVERHDLGPVLQSFPQDVIRSQLCRMYAICDKIVLKTQYQIVNSVNLKYRKQLVEAFKRSNRKSTAADRSNRIEKLKTIQEKAVNRRKANQLIAARQREQAKLDEERQRRDAEIKRQEEERASELKRIQNQQNLTFVLQSDFGRQELADKTPEELAQIDIKSLQQQKIERELKAEREKQDKLATQGKKVDYFVRACHSEEIPLLKVYIADYLSRRSKHRQVTEKEIIDTAVHERDLQLANRDRLNRMAKYTREFYDRLLSARKADHDRKLSEFERQMSEERQRLQLQRKQRRKEERRAAWLKAKAEQEKQELEKKKREENERIRKAAEERQRMELEKFKKYQEQMALKQRQETTAATAASTVEASSSKSTSDQQHQPASAAGRWRQPPKLGTSVSMTSRGQSSSHQQQSSRTNRGYESVRSGTRNFDALMQSQPQQAGRRDDGPGDFNGRPFYKNSFNSMRQAPDSRRREGGFPDYRSGNDPYSSNRSGGYFKGNSNAFPPSTPNENDDNRDSRFPRRERKPQQS